MHAYCSRQRAPSQTRARPRSALPAADGYNRRQACFTCGGDPGFNGTTWCETASFIFESRAYATFCMSALQGVRSLPPTAPHHTFRVTS